MTADRILEYCRAVPFTPFRVHLANSRVIEVSHPDYTLVTPSGRYFVHYRDDDSHETVDVLLINSIETLPPAASEPPGVTTASLA